MQKCKNIELQCFVIRFKTNRCNYFFLHLFRNSKTTMEKTIIIKPNSKTLAVLRKLVDLKEEHRKEVVSKLKKK